MSREDRDHDMAGWYNFCRQCGARYWVRAVDVPLPRVRRFVAKDSNGRHVCEAAP